MFGLTTVDLIAFITLIILEIVLGIDNIIFIAILSGKLPKDERPRARMLGIGVAVISRIMLLLFINVITKLTEPILTLPMRDHGLSGKEILLLIGGLFLIGKSTIEIYEKLEAKEHDHATGKAASLAGVMLQVLVVDIVFSLDSVITAVGISGKLPVMIGAILGASLVMVFFANIVADFVDKHPTIKILALAFLIMIGAMLVFEGWDHTAAETLHIKNYIYFAMAFSLLVDLLQIRMKKPEPVHLHNTPREHDTLPPTAQLQQENEQLRQQITQLEKRIKK
jgi:predicted tellurium resistance membrane protein TerC